VFRAFNDLEVYVAVAEKLNFAAAARAVQLSPSAVSKCITQMESELGVTLVTRSTHHISLTDAGLSFYDRCVRILSDLDEARNEARDACDDVSGTLRVFAPLCVGQGLIAPAIAEFLAQHPGLSIDLTMNPGRINLLESRLDVVIRSRKWHQPTERSVVTQVLGRVPYVICASPAHLAAHGLPGAPKDLLHRNCLLHTTQEGAADWRFVSPARGAVHVSGSFSSNTSLAVRAAVLRGIGIARLPDYVVAQDIKAGALVELFAGQVLSDRTIKAFYPRSLRPPAKVRLLLEFLQTALKTDLEKPARVAEPA